MSKQNKLGSKEYEEVFIYFKEITSDTLEKKTLQDNTHIENFLEIIHSFNKQTNVHNIEDLKMDDNPEMFVESVFEDYPDLQNRMPRMLVNSFSNSMKTRAREEGKYAILIILKDSIIICHTDAEEKTISKDVNIIERLLDIDNVDKYVEFNIDRSGNDENIQVSHFERHKSDSLSEWLGLPSKGLSFNDAGKISFYTEIDGATCSFEFTMNEFEQKFMLDENYSLENGVLKTPKGNDHVIEQVKIGRRTFHDVREFKQKFMSIHYNLDTYKEVYKELSNSLEPVGKQIIDYEDRVAESGRGRPIIAKENPNFDIIFTNQFIEMDIGWQKKIFRDFTEDKEFRFYHPSLPLSEETTDIGNYKFFHDLGIEEETEKWLNSYHYFIKSAGVGESLENIIKYSIFSVSAVLVDEPIEYLFQYMKEEAKQRIDVEGLLMNGENSFLEFKSRQWIAEEQKSDIIKKLNKEIQGNARLVLVGINEEEQKIRPLNRGNFDSELINSIEDKLKERNTGMADLVVDTIPLGEGNCLLFALAIEEETDIPAQLPDENLLID